MGWRADLRRPGGAGAGRGRVVRWDAGKLPLRAGTGWISEGGIRVPMIVRWPGVTKPSELCTAPVISTALFPTALEAAGL